MPWNNQAYASSLSRMALTSMSWLVLTPIPNMYCTKWPFFPFFIAENCVLIAHIICSSPLASSNHTENDLGHDWTDFSECRKLLFSAGADPTLKGSNGKTLLFTLAVEGTVVSPPVAKMVNDEVTLSSNLCEIC